MSELAARAARLRERALRDPAWDAAGFDALLPAASALERSLGADPERSRLVNAFLELCAEAAHQGYLAEGGVFRLLLGKLVPESLPRTVEPRLALLAQAFNVAEGLVRDLPWLEPYVAIRLGAEDAVLGELAPHVARILQSVLVPGPPLPLAAPLALYVLSLRPALADLLPGALELVTPRLLRISDRDSPSRTVGVAVPPGGRPALVGALPAAGLPRAEPAPVVMELQDSRIQVGQLRVFAPGLRAGFASLVSHAPFAAAVAIDSQCLWIVAPAESA